MATATGHCDDLASPNYANFAISLLILLGIFVSYLPQHHRIIARRSSQGISPYFVLLGATSSTCAFANILVLPTSRADIACCKEVNGFECFVGLLGIAQVGVQWSCFTLILLLFLLFFPRSTPLTPPKSPASPSGATPPTYTLAITVTAVSLLHILLTALLSIYILALYPNIAQQWANILGILTTILASIQYLPQLYTTYLLKSVGSLSIPMMCIQTPGSLVWAASLAARVGTKGWSAWVVYVVTGCLQGGLLGMGIWFEFQERKRKRQGGASGAANGANGREIDRTVGEHETDDEGGHHIEGDGEEGSDERSPLLGSGR
ncbi:MAG: hypothetical protein M1827_002446 [Pycnora praestabilis]|nr:MAG: hypothetical protein M1827_002446 [Pycnora praestabilis]